MMASSAVGGVSTSIAPFFAQVTLEGLLHDKGTSFKKNIAQGISSQAERLKSLIESLLTQNAVQSERAAFKTNHEALIKCNVTVKDLKKQKQRQTTEGKVLEECHQTTQNALESFKELNRVLVLVEKAVREQTSRWLKTPRDYKEDARLALQSLMKKAAPPPQAKIEESKEKKEATMTATPVMAVVMDNKPSTEFSEIIETSKMTIIVEEPTKEDLAAMRQPQPAQQQSNNDNNPPPSAETNEWFFTRWLNWLFGPAAAPAPINNASATPSDGTAPVPKVNATTSQ